MVATQPTVLILDDDQDARESLTSLLGEAGFAVEAFSLAGELIERLAPGKRQCPDCMIVDLQLPDMDAIELLQAIRGTGCISPFIVITGFGDVRSAVRAMRAGAADFLTKPFDTDQLIERLREVVAEAATARRRHQELESVAERLGSLTRRERQVLTRVIDGKVTKQIAEELGISSKTVEVHRSHLTRKMHVRSVAELVRVVTKYELENEAGDEPT